MDKTKEIDLRELMRNLARKAWLLVLCAVIVAVAAYIYTAAFVTPLYRAQVTLYINNSVYSGSQIEASDLATSQRLAITCKYILQTDRVLSKVIEQTGWDLKPSQIRGAISASSPEETEIFIVSVVHSDPHVAAQLANAIAQVAPGEISSIIAGSSTKVIDFADVPSAPYSPSKTRNAVIGALVGLLLAVGIVVLEMMLDVQIRSEEELGKISNIVVLGRIPDFEEHTSGYLKKSRATSKRTEILDEE